MIKKPLAYISAAWSGTETENMEAARRYCRAVYEAGFSPICPRLYLPLFIDDAIPANTRTVSTWPAICCGAPTS